MKLNTSLGITLILFSFFLSGCTYLQKNAIRECPDSWYSNQMPGTFEPNEESSPREYMSLKGQRREISEFDMEWVGKNCNITKQDVY
jgi:hypothetical protein